MTAMVRDRGFWRPFVADPGIERQLGRELGAASRRRPGGRGRRRARRRRRPRAATRPPRIRPRPPTRAARLDTHEHGLAHVARPGGRHDAARARLRRAEPLDVVHERTTATLDPQPQLELAAALAVAAERDLLDDHGGGVGGESHDVLARWSEPSHRHHRVRPPQQAPALGDRDRGGHHRQRRQSAPARSSWRRRCRCRRWRPGRRRPRARDRRRPPAPRPTTRAARATPDRRIANGGSDRMSTGIDRTPSDMTRRCAVAFTTREPRAMLRHCSRTQSAIGAAPSGVTNDAGSTGPPSRLVARVGEHPVDVGTDVRREVGLVDHEQVGLARRRAHPCAGRRRRPPCRARRSARRRARG